MRYYVIINGVNSLTIEGLAIRTLPPISKPAMRNLREEIDGRDGDITTELGYGAYDRPLEIGLFGDYDINKIISFFNSKGTIIFSDEPDKYYNFEIVDKIDYTKLVKFRTATINIHCQPFKYPVSEEPQVEEYEYVEATGTNVTLDNTSEAIFNKIDLLGNTSQQTYTGKNKFGVPNDTNTTQGVTITTTDNNITFVGTPTSAYVNSNVRTLDVPIPAGTYTISSTNTSYNFFLWFKDDNNTTIASANLYKSEKKITLSHPATRIQYGVETLTIGTAYNIETKFQVETGSSATDFEPYVGGIPSPNPNYPQDVHVVSGDNTIDICGKNLLKFDNSQNTNKSNWSYTTETPELIVCSKVSGGGSFYAVYETYVEENQQYTISVEDDTNRNLYCYKDVIWGTAVSGLTNKNINKTTSLTFTSSYTGKMIVGFFTSDATKTLTKPQIEKGSIATEYEPYQSQNYTISLGNIELCKIGTYQDYIYKDSGKWYLHKEIGKIVLDGSENWERYGAYGSFYLYYIDNITDGWTSDNNEYDTGNGLSNRYIWLYSSVNTNPTNPYIRFQYKNGKRLYIGHSTDLTLADFKTWLGNNNVIAYYVLANSTTTLITDTTLINQLEAIKNAVSYSGQTNVSQINNDLPFMMEVSALKLGSDHLEINNTGNIYAKPTMDLEGTGVVDIYLNDVQILEADLTETNNIVIDTEAMEAYNPDTNALANRQVTGDYSKIKLEPGENDLRFSGALSKATITNWERWL